MADSSLLRISLIAKYTVAALMELSASGVLAISTGATPAAMATSVRVHCRPPKQRAASVNRKATLSGPIETLCCVDERIRFYRINTSYSICLLVTVERGIFVGEKVLCGVHNKN